MTPTEPVQAISVRPPPTIKRVTFGELFDRMTAGEQVAVIGVISAGSTAALLLGLVFQPALFLVTFGSALTGYVIRAFHNAYRKVRGL